jgi:hypothetical protein
MDESHARPGMPTRVTFAALVLAACVLLPVDPHRGTSMLRFLLDTFREDWLIGIVSTVLLGSPYAFAVAVACSGTAGGPLSRVWVRAQVALLQTEVVVLGLLVLRNLDEHNARAPWAMIGFAATTIVVFVRHVASPAVPEGHRDPRFFTRWGAILVAGTFAWFLLQVLGRAEYGGVLPGTLAAAFLLAAVTPASRRDR